MPSEPRIRPSVSPSTRPIRTTSLDTLAGSTRPVVSALTASRNAMSTGIPPTTSMVKTARIQRLPKRPVIFRTRGMESKKLSSDRLNKGVRWMPGPSRLSAARTVAANVTVAAAPAKCSIARHNRIEPGSGGPSGSKTECPVVVRQDIASWMAAVALEFGSPSKNGGAQARPVNTQKNTMKARPSEGCARRAGRPTMTSDAPLTVASRTPVVRKTLNCAHSPSIMATSDVKPMAITKPKPLKASILMIAG